MAAFGTQQVLRLSSKNSKSRSKVVKRGWGNSLHLSRDDDCGCASVHGFSLTLVSYSLQRKRTRTPTGFGEDMNDQRTCDSLWKRGLRCEVCLCRLLFVSFPFLPLFYFFLTSSFCPTSTLPIHPSSSTPLPFAHTRPPPDCISSRDGLPRLERVPGPVRRLGHATRPTVTAQAHPPRPHGHLLLPHSCNLQVCP